MIHIQEARARLLEREERHSREGLENNNLAKATTVTRLIMTTPHWRTDPDVKLVMWRHYASLDSDQLHSTGPHRTICRRLKSIGAPRHFLQFHVKFADTVDLVIYRCFPMSLRKGPLRWFQSLPHCSIQCWNDITPPAWPCDKEAHALLKKCWTFGSSSISHFINTLLN